MQIQNSYDLQLWTVDTVENFYDNDDDKTFKTAEPLHDLYILSNSHIKFQRTEDIWLDILPFTALWQDTFMSWSGWPKHSRAVTNLSATGAQSILNIDTSLENTAVN